MNFPETVQIERHRRGPLGSLLWRPSFSPGIQSPDYSDPFGLPPVRFLAQVRDVSATIDSQLSGPGFKNDADNEDTGFHFSDGDPGLRPSSQNGWRIFYTQQHGDNVTWEVVKTRPSVSARLILF